MLSISETLINFIHYLFIPAFFLIAIQKKWGWLLSAGIGLSYLFIYDFYSKNFLFVAINIYGFYFWHTTEKQTAVYIPEKIDESLLDTMYTIPEENSLKENSFSLPTQSKDFQLIGIILAINFLLFLVGFNSNSFLNFSSLNSIYFLLNTAGTGLLIQKRKLGFILSIGATMVSLLDVFINYGDSVGATFFIEPLVGVGICIFGYQRWSKG